MKVLVLGATGATGKHVLEKALAAGHEVTALVRDTANLAERAGKLRVVKGRATVTADVAGVVPGHDAVISALGPRENADPVCFEAAQAVVGAMEAAGVGRLIWLSAGGVGDSAPQIIDASFVFGRIIMPLFLRRPYANHARAEALIAASKLAWTIVRPVQLVDAPTGRPVQATLPGGKVGGLKIAREDVAAFMVDALASTTHVGQYPLLYT